jgi:tRNA 2-selenouridine synthase
MSFQSLDKIGINKFLELAEKYQVVDVRSPSEFKAGHIPGSVNIPLFDDRERESVGVKYAKEGRSKAILRGIEMTGPAMHLKLKEAIRVAQKELLLLYCWRGGMRSEAMAWLFSLGDIPVEVLEGGYKSYRHHILAGLSVKRKTIVLGGMTGSSKTHILKRLKELNHQVIDLERLANHKGSAFGAFGKPPQPSSEHFTNLLYNEWKNLANDLPVWMEDESRNIGTVFMPDLFYENLNDSPVIVLIMDIRTRMPRLVEEYSAYPNDMIRESIVRISKRLGGDNTKEALSAVDTGNFEKAVEIVLRYYDKAYMFGINRKRSGNIIYIETDTDDIDINAGKVLEAADKIRW